MEWRFLSGIICVFLSFFFCTKLEGVAEECCYLKYAFSIVKGTETTLKFISDLFIGHSCGMISSTEFDGPKQIGQKS